jgi:hypothetical protein
MKLGLFIAVAMICLSSTAAQASPSLADQAASRSRAGDRAGAIALYRKAYELESDPALLVRMAHEYRRAGNNREALAHFCRYMYVEAAGVLADEASTNARAISAELGTPTDSDHTACSSRPRASQASSAQAAPVAPAVDTLALVLAAPPPSITKREIAGLITLGGTVGSLGLSLLEARRIKEARADINAASAPGTNLDALIDRRDGAELRQKLFLAVGGATLLTGGILYVTGRAERKRAEQAYVAPSLNKNGAGLVLGGRF